MSDGRVQISSKEIMEVFLFSISFEELLELETFSKMWNELRHVISNNAAFWQV